MTEDEGAMDRHDAAAGRRRIDGAAVGAVAADAAVEQQLLQRHQFAGVLQIRQLALVALQLLLNRLELRMLGAQHQLGVVAHFAQILQRLKINFFNNFYSLKKKLIKFIFLSIFLNSFFLIKKCFFYQCFLI